VLRIHVVFTRRRCLAEKEGWILPTCKPGSVECCHSDDHSSRNTVACILEQPTRSVLIEVGHLSLPIWPCSRWGLPCRDCYQSCGELLPHRFTLACVLNQHHRRFAFCCTIRQCLAALPRSYLAACPLEPGLSSRRENSSRSSGRQHPSTR
jgi:hypothetical protein